MTIQSLYDQRSAFAKLIQIFNSDGVNKRYDKSNEYPNILKFYASGYINNLLRHFYEQTSHLGMPGKLQLCEKGVFYEGTNRDFSIASQDENRRKIKRMEQDVATRVMHL